MELADILPTWSKGSDGGGLGLLLLILESRRNIEKKKETPATNIKILIHHQLIVMTLNHLGKTNY